MRRLLALALAFTFALSTFANAQLLTRGVGPGGIFPGSAFLAENRPASLALTPNVTTTGDSIPFGVGVADSGNYSFQNALQTYMSSGTITKAAVSGMAWTLPSSLGNTSPIPNQITGSANYTTNTQLTMGSVNGYNTAVVVSTADGQIWESYVTSGIASALSGLTQSWVYFAGIYDETQGPGMARYADWRHLLSTLTTTYGGRIYDLPRALQFRGSADVTTLDWKNIDQWSGLPLSFRGMPQDPSGTIVPFSNIPLPTAWLTCSTATNTSLGIAAAIGCGDPTLQAEGAFAQNLNTTGNIPLNTLWRVGVVSGANKWELIDTLHMSRWGSAAWAQTAFDLLAARQGAGAPVGAPARLYCAQDVAAAGSCGTIQYVGNATPVSALLFDSSSNLVTTLALGVNAPAAGKGTITVTRSGTGTLTEGTHPQYILQTTDGSGHVIHSPVDLYVGEPSTQTVPRMWLIPGTPGNTNSAFSGAGRSAHGLNDAGKYWFALWLKPNSIATDIEYIFDLHQANGDNARIFVRINTSGGLTVVAQDSTSGAVVLNNSQNSVFADNTPTWALVDIDFTLAQPTARGVFCKGACGTNGTVTITSGLSAGPYTFHMSKIEPRFFALAYATINDQNRGSSPIGTRDQYTGSFGEIMFGNGNVGIVADPTIANGLWTPATGAPVARACGASIGGQAPVWDWRGGVDDLLMGGKCLPDEPIFSSFAQTKNLTANP